MTLYFFFFQVAKEMKHVVLQDMSGKVIGPYRLVGFCREVSGYKFKASK